METIRTPGIEIVDNNGRVRAVLGAAAGDTFGLTLYDEHGSARASFVMVQYGSLLSLSIGGNTALELGAFSDEGEDGEPEPGPYLVMLDDRQVEVHRIAP